MFINLRAIWVLLILLSPFIFIAIISNIEAALNPDKYLEKQFNDATYKNTLYSEKFSSEVTDKCEVYVDNKPLWDECFSNTFKEQLRLNGYSDSSER